LLLDLIPPKGKSGKESHLVMLSRAEEITQIGLTRSLWNGPDSRKEFILKLNKHLKLQDEKVIELKRMQRISDSLKKNYIILFQRANEIGVIRANTYHFEPICSKEQIRITSNQYVLNLAKKGYTHNNKTWKANMF